MKTLQDLQARLVPGTVYWAVAGEFNTEIPTAKAQFNEFLASLPIRVTVTHIEEGKAIYGADEDELADGKEEIIMNLNDDSMELVWKVLDNDTFQIGGDIEGLPMPVPKVVFSFIEPKAAA